MYNFFHDAGGALQILSFDTNAHTPSMLCFAHILGLECLHPTVNNSVSQLSNGRF
jgi:hypothetical protein